MRTHVESFFFLIICYIPTISRQNTESFRRKPICSRPVLPKPAKSQMDPSKDLFKGRLSALSSFIKPKLCATSSFHLWRLLLLCVQAKARANLITYRERYLHGCMFIKHAAEIREDRAQIIYPEAWWLPAATRRRQGSLLAFPRAEISSRPRNPACVSRSCPIFTVREFGNPRRVRLESRENALSLVLLPAFDGIYPVLSWVNRYPHHLG